MLDDDELFLCHDMVFRLYFDILLLSWFGIPW